MKNLASELFDKYLDEQEEIALQATTTKKTAKGATKAAQKEQAKTLLAAKKKQ